MDPIKYSKFLVGHLSSQFGSGDDIKDLQQLLQEAKEYYTPFLPRNADADTRMDSVEVEGTHLIMENTLFTVSKDELDIDDFKETLRGILRDEAHRTKRLQRILSRGGTLVYRYKDMNGEPVTEIGLVIG